MGRFGEVNEEPENFERFGGSTVFLPSAGSPTVFLGFRTTVFVFRVLILLLMRDVTAEYVRTFRRICWRRVFEEFGRLYGEEKRRFEEV